jgi:ribosomal protein L11 methyltransferase
MKNKSLWRVSVATTSEAEESIAELLVTALGQTASLYFNVESEVSVVSVYSSKKILSREVREEISAGLKRIKNCGLKIGVGKITIAKVRREDWAESWKRHFKPIEIGNALLVKPSWSKKNPCKNQAVVILDPGLSFGTGQHPTTAFCLQEIARCHKIGMRQSFLDIGTGSGILAIATAKLGYKPVRALDFDPEAVRVARSNACVNSVLKKIKIERGDVTKLPAKPKEQFDLVCANLISTLLIAERRRIAAQLNRGGVLVLAGILKSEFSEVQKKFEALGLKLIASGSRKEWRSGSFCFKRKNN